MNKTDATNKYCMRAKNTTCKKAPTCVEINQIYKISPSTVHTMQRRLILLWNTRDRHKNSQTLRPKHKEALELWEHIQDCHDKDCKRKYCWSSCRILDHFHRCRVSNRRSNCKLCAPVIKQIKQNSRGNNGSMNRQDSKIETKRPFDRISDGNKKPCISYKLKRRNALSHVRAHRCTVIRWDESVKCGQGEDSVAHIVKKRPLLLQGVQRYTNEQAYKRGKVRNIRTPKRIIPSGGRSGMNSSADTSINFEISYIMKEDRKEIVDASIVLMGMEKNMR